MSDAEVGLLSATLKGQHCYLEFGCGGSTVLAASLGIPKVTSVDSDPAWMDKVASQPQVKAIQFQPVLINLGPTKDWGRPQDSRQAFGWPAYSSAVWDQLTQAPGLVLIDGRFRVACALQTLLHCPAKTTLAFHDFWPREHYHCVLKHLRCVARADSLAIFKAKPKVDWKDLAKDLARHLLDQE
jgi:hypothetical protein